LSATYVSAAWKDIIVFVILIAVLLIRPHGLLAPARQA
jgi:branched-subunit amino acid ABC-type transport system permease component